MAGRQVKAGSQIRFPGTRIAASSDAYLAFIDGDPTANWGHPARYLVVDRESGEMRSLGARLPPFSSRQDMRWIVAYQAPSVPDAAVERLEK